jgi:hypothetical protein
MKKALITGITGQDGSYLSEFLLKKGYIVHGIKRRTSLFNTQRIDYLYKDPQEENSHFILHHGDMTDSSSLMRIIKEIQPDEIYNLAAQSHVAVSFEEPEYTANSDALGALRILEAIRILDLNKKTRFYQASTSEIFGQVKESPQNENTPMYPRSPYGVAKVYALEQIKWMTDRVGLKIIDVQFNKINGGSFSIVVAHSKSNYKVYPFLKELLDVEKSKSLNTLKLFLEFSKRVEEFRSKFVNFLEKAREKGKRVGALGASTKGNVILQYCGINEKQINFVAEINPEKFGCFTPGTLLPIISEDAALQKNPDYLIVLPWHFKEFFIKNKKFNKIKLIFPLPTMDF